MARQTREGGRFLDELLDELLGGADPAQVFRDGGLVDDLKKALAERALNAEMDAHLDREPERSSGNHRNGHNRKRVLMGSGSTSVLRPPATGRSTCWFASRMTGTWKPADLVAMPADGPPLCVPLPEDIEGVYQLIEHEGVCLGARDPRSRVEAGAPAAFDARLQAGRR